MSDYLPHTGYAAISQVEAYWDTLRAGRLMPKRSEIDPRGIETALEHAFILERITIGVARMRIAGSHLADLMGMEVRGMPLTSLFDTTVRRDVGGLLEEVFQTPCRVDLTLSCPTLIDTQAEARMILLPLKSDMGDVSRILGCLVAKGDDRVVPSQFKIEHVDRVTLTAAGPEHAADHAAPAQPGFAEPSTPFAAAPQQTGKERPPYLRLVQDNTKS
ncbi:PAS domain-containing protein [Sulfitobacter sp. S190]|uniref:PAS domain-containing protein n=1 Tax=Sulfitobacter sp. S190 TaxID=2867022 RepID=UPI0021A8A821|nr:PAS domain-containing protein [Sulfitobacter sp. S190]